MKSRGMYKAARVSLKDGFYIEIFEPGVKKGMKIRSDNKQGMDEMASQYASYKRVVILGEFKDGLALSGLPVN
ncbi:MAG: hypothetical protein ABIR30_05330 [Chitinophagaceae bacterium]